MARWLKRGMDAGAIKAADAKVRETVEGILAQVDARKDAAIRDLSKKFDNWAPKDFRLTPHEIESAIAQVPKRDLEDIKFAQAQVRNFAQKQRETMHDLEVETLPGVVLGHRHIPVNCDRLLRAGRSLSDGRLGAHVDRHRQGRRRETHHRLRAAVQGRPASRPSSPPCISAAPTRSYVLGGVQAVAAMALGTESIAAGRHDRRSGQCLRRRGQAPIVRPRRHRSARRPDRNADHRRRQRRRRNLRHRPARARPNTAPPPRPCCSPIPKSSRATPWRKSSAC